MSPDRTRSRTIFWPSCVRKKRRSRPVSKRNKCPAGHPWLIITDLAENRCRVPASRIVLTSAAFTPWRNRGFRCFSNASTGALILTSPVRDALGAPVGRNEAQGVTIDIPPLTTLSQFDPGLHNSLVCGCQLPRSGLFLVDCECAAHALST